MAAAFEGPVEVTGDLFVTDVNGDTLTIFRKDGTSFHKGKETFAGGIVLINSDGSEAISMMVDADPNTEYTLKVNGNLDVSGIMAAATKQFKIDHPLDSENRYLYHTSVESPDMKNVYDGVITLDENGEAIVVLPDWFETLNGDFRYQHRSSFRIPLTARGSRKTQEQKREDSEMTTTCLRKAAPFLVVLCMGTSLVAQTEIRSSVFGNGSTPTSNSSMRIAGTVGQAAVGTTAGPTNGVNGGFWTQELAVTTGVEERPVETLPEQFRLHPTYPNPFNPETTIRYDLPVTTRVRLTVFDVQDRAVRTLVSQTQSAGTQVAVWDGRDDAGRQLASGVYLLRLEASTIHKTRKTLFLK